MNDLVQLLIYILLGGLLVYAVQWVIGLLNLPAVVKNVILLVVAILVIVWLLRTFGLM